MKKLLVLTLSATMLAACGQSNSGHEGHEKASSETKVKPVTVELTTPKMAKANEKVTLKALVKQDGKAINDADEVMFEVINTKTNKSDKQKVTKATNGLYTLDYTFKEDGSYKVISHVTAKNQHTMPSKMVTVGEAKEHEHHDHHGGMIHIMPITAKVNEKTNFMIHVHSSDDNAVKDADTKLEITTPDNKTVWVELKQTKDGQYEGSETFKTPGKYHVKAHAENKKFHTHEESDFEVK